MGDEWVPTKVADLKVGDEVRDCGVVRHLDKWADGGECRLDLIGHTPLAYWPAHARVDVRTPPEVTVAQHASGWVSVHIGDKCVGDFTAQRHAECYAEKLRNDPTLRAEALGS